MGARTVCPAVAGGHSRTATPCGSDRPVGRIRPGIDDSPIACGNREGAVQLAQRVDVPQRPRTDLADRVDADVNEGDLVNPAPVCARYLDV